MYQRTVLPNGIRIITEYLPYLHSVALGAWFEVGSRHEEPQEWGISHFIEHMVLRAIKNTRPGTLLRSWTSGEGI